MSDPLKTPTIGIDRGASFTDFAVIESGSLAETLSIEKRDWQSITDTYKRMTDRYHNHRTVFTGSFAGMPAQIINRFGTLGIEEINDCPIINDISEIFNFLTL